MRKLCSHKAGYNQFPSSLTLKHHSYCHLMLIRILTLLIFSVCAGDSSAAETTDLVDSSVGTLPIIITVPHGGMKRVPGVEVRSKPTTQKFNIGTDRGTSEFSKLLIKELSTSLKGEPYVVRADFSRKYIDPNRAPEGAYEVPAAKPIYDTYHSRIREFIAEIKKKFPNGSLLLDIHGHPLPAYDDTFVRGTDNGLSVAKMIEKHGPDSLIGPKSVFGVLQAKGHKVHPPNTPMGKPVEDLRLQGSFTIRTYGSHTEQGIDALQVEMGSKLRSPKVMPELARDFAEAITVFHNTYLVGTPSKTSESSTTSSKETSQ
jgi:N-formylglutamate amidohydrolase